MVDDLGPLLEQWPYDPEHPVRRIQGLDGRPKLQVRLPLGIEQYELTGRPDGKRPDGLESVLEHYEKALAAHVQQHGGDEGFVLSRDDCRRLHEEGVLYYYRYLLCYQIGEFAQVERDTAHNIRVFRLVGKYGENEEDRKDLEQYWPYILRIRAMAQAFRALGEGEEKRALALLRRAVETIEALPEVDTPVFSLEKERSLGVLKETLDSLEAAKPVSEREELVKRLARAIRNENYEQAARLRDIIARMQQ